jgi:DNA-binding CsgD family transcriptional regulator
MVLSPNKPAVCPILIGRTTDLATLHQLIDQAKGGRGHVVLLSGEAGLGKSRLVAEAKTYATTQNFLLLQGDCFPADLSCPYAPLLDLLRTYAASLLTATITSNVAPFPREISPLLPELVPLPLDQPLASSLDPEQEKRRLFAALAQFFIGQARKQAVLLIIEDIHWSDDTSLEFLHYLARHSTTQPLLLLLTYRNDEVRPRLRQFLAQLDRERLAQELWLAHLTRDDVDAMLRAIFSLPRSARLELPDSIYELTEGNPFFVEEVLKSLIATGDIFYLNGRWERKPLAELRIPRSVQDAFELRTDLLSDQARRVLTLAAVVGRHFDFALLQALTQHDEAELLRLIKELVAAQLVVEESAEQFAFRHALTRQAVYAQLLVRERKALHRTIAETLERLYTSTLEAHLADLASHFFEAGVWEKALEYGQRAGEQAQTLYAPQAATLHFTRALDAARQLSLTPPASLYRARGLAFETLGDFERARADQETALHLAHNASDRHAEWRSFIDLGLLWAGRDYAQTGDYYQQALALARSMDDAATLAHSLNRLGNWYLNAEQPQEALRCHQEALATFQGLHNRSGMAATQDLLGMASYLSGELLQGAAYYEQAIALFRELDERERLPNSLATLMCCGGNYGTETVVPPAVGFAESLKLGELAVKSASEIGRRSDEAYTMTQMSMCLGPRGQYARALELAQRGLAIAEEIEHRQWMTAGHLALGALALDVLALSQARLHLEQAMALAQQIRSQIWIRLTAGLLARVYLLQHDPERAESLLSSWLSPDTPFHTMGQRTMWQSRAEILLAHGDTAQALQIIEGLISTAANLTPEQSIPLLWKLRAEALIDLQRYDEAEATLQQAEASARKQVLRPLLWRIWLVQARLAQHLRRHEETEQAFARAFLLIEELAADLPEQNWRATFLQQTRSRIPRTGPLSARRLNKEAFSGLTEREREVAALIAQGKSNREIADTLVVGVRTVEAHISKIFSKLGCSSRAQIASWATEKGLTSHRLS